jgi:hypothetical protein
MAMHQLEQLSSLPPLQRGSAREKIFIPTAWIEIPPIARTPGASFYFDRHCQIVYDGNTLMVSSI